jgi:hypothetical protein
MTERDEFYVGYGKAIPPGMARVIRVTLVILLSLTAVVALIAISGQRKLGASYFEFGSPREFRGIIREFPYPFLEIERPGEHGGLPGFSRYVLVGEGKHGAEPNVAGLDGRTVTLKGTLIHRENQTMIEVATGSVVLKESIPPRPETEKVEELGTVTLRGEIVDSKCHLGVMNPGSGKVHRGCAVRCISGGAPPVFHTRDAAGTSRYFYLVLPEGKAVNRDVLDVVAEPLEITGRATRIGTTFFLAAEPGSYRRLAP